MKVIFLEMKFGASTEQPSSANTANGIASVEECSVDSRLASH